MKVSFENLNDCFTLIENFRLKWRFTDERYNILPTIHIEQLKPLNCEGSEFVWDFISKSGLHNHTPFKTDFFKTIVKAKIKNTNQKEIKKWLFKRGFPFDKEVILSWQPDLAMIVPWKLFVKYYDSFYYNISDDLTIIDKSLNWAILFYHENEIYFGTNEHYITDTSFKDEKFIWD